MSGEGGVEDKDFQVHNWSLSLASVVSFAVAKWSTEMLLFGAMLP